MKPFSISLLLGFLFSLLQPVVIQADFLPEGKKQVSSYYKITGWENVEDYIIVQPLFGEWELCPWPNTNSAQKTFYLTNEGDKSNFGQESHSNAYYHLVAIKKEFIEDIYADNTESYKPLYVISCDSSAYNTAAVTTTVIPLSDNVVDENDPLIQVEYTIDLKGVDPNSNQLIMTVSEATLQSDPILAQQFVESLDDDRNKLVDTKPYLTNAPTRLTTAPTPLTTPQFQVKDSTSGEIQKPQKKFADSNNGILITNPVWPAAVLISISSISFLVGLTIGKRKKQLNSQLTPQDVPPHTSEL